MRTIPPTLTTILNGSERRLDYSLDIIFPDSTFFRFATLPIVKSAITYTNDLESVGELRQTLETPSDKVRIGIENKDRVLGVHVAQYWQKWRKAEAVIERLYRNKSGSLSQWVEFFRGSIQQPDANNLQVVFDIMSDVLSPGSIVANRTLAGPCSFPFKDPKTCAYSGPLTTCNHLLKSAGGCDGRANSQHFGGTEHRYQIETSVPGTGGNTGGTRDTPVNPCPRIDQYVLVRGENNKPVPKMVGFLTEDDYLWHPVKEKFFKVAFAKLVKDVPIFESLSASSAVVYSSGSHPNIQNKADDKGKAVEKFRAGDELLTVLKNRIYCLNQSKCVLAKPTGERGDVIMIEMEDGHIYCAGDSREKFIVCHNRKYDLPE